MRKASVPLAAALALALLWAPPLFAQTRIAPGASASPAEQLFRQGRAAAEAGDFGTACDRFAASEKLEPAPGTLLNVADCEVHLGKLLSAEEHFELAASGFPKNDPRRTFVSERVAELRRRLAHITVHLAPTLPPTARVTRDGEAFERRSAGTALPADPRPTSFVVSAPGFFDRSFPLTLAEGQSAEITLETGAPAPTAGNPPAGSSRDQPAVTRTDDGAAPMRRPWRTIGVATGAVGVAGLVAGGITGGLALHEAQVVKDNCQLPAYTCKPPGVSAGSSGQSFALASTVAFVAGAALAATGLVFIVVGGKHEAERTSLSVVPYFGGSSGGGIATLRF